MVVLIDTNVIIDYLLTRQPYYEASSGIILKCAQKKLVGILHFIQYRIFGIFYERFRK